MKYQVMLSYVTDISSIISKKIKGKSLRNDKSVDRLIENRTVSLQIFNSWELKTKISFKVLEKMKPIDKKLKYQIDKLIKTTSATTSG